MDFLKLVAFVWTDALASAHRSGLMIPSIAWKGGVTGGGLNKLPLILITRFCATLAAIAEAFFRHWIVCDNGDGSPRRLQGCTMTACWLSSLSRYTPWSSES